MPFMSRIHLISLSLVLILLSGCASLAPVEPLTTSVQSSEPVSEPEQAGLPAVELSGEILFRLLAADLAVQRQQFELAAGLYLIVAQETQDPRLAEQAARMALFSRRDREALDAARLWVALVPESRAGREAIVSAYIRNGDGQGAQEHLEFLLNSGDDAEQIFQLVVSLLQHEWETRTAFDAIQSLVDRHADNPDAQFALAYIALHARELDVARSAVEKVLVMRPRWLRAMNLYARIMRMQGNPFEAAIYLAGVVEEFPDVEHVRINYARLLVETRQLDEALEQYLWIVDKEPRNEDALFAAALLSLQLNDLDQARDFLQRLVIEGARLDVAHFYLGQIAESDNRNGVAIDHYAEVSTGEHYLDAQTRMIMLLAQRGDVLLARGYLDKIREQVPNESSRINELEGHILEEDGQLEEAMRIYDVALVNAPDDKDLLFRQALLAEKMGRLGLAEEKLLYILKMDPDSVRALNALGFSLADHTTRYQEAYGYLQRAIALRPDSAAILDSMGWVLYRLGRLDEALEYLRRSLVIRQDQEVAAHLGEVLWMRGDHDEARTIWQQGLEQAPDDKFILDVMKRFGQ